MPMDLVFHTLSIIDIDPMRVMPKNLNTIEIPYRVHHKITFFQKNKSWLSTYYTDIGCDPWKSLSGIKNLIITFGMYNLAMWLQ